MDLLESVEILTKNNWWLDRNDSGLWAVGPECEDGSMEVLGLGKTLQVISFLSALMRKSGTLSDKERRRNRVSQLQDSEGWLENRKLPPPDDKWPTALIIAPSSVVNVWTREFDKVIVLVYPRVHHGTDITKWGYFEVGAYIGTPSERERVLNDFTLGRLDIGVSYFSSSPHGSSI